MCALFAVQHAGNSEWQQSIGTAWWCLCRLQHVMLRDTHGAASAFPVDAPFWPGHCVRPVIHWESVSHHRCVLMDATDEHPVRKWEGQEGSGGGEAPSHEMTSNSYVSVSGVLVTPQMTGQQRPGCCVG